MGLREILGKEILLFDGATGTMIQSRGLKLGELPEALNIHSPEIVRQIHTAYIEAGSRILTTNTFGANSRKLAASGYSVEQVIPAAVKNARDAIGDRDVYIALDIGPIGELLAPMGTLSFEEAYEIFREQVVCGVQAGADAILIETMTDLYEAKAAVLAAKEHSDLPVFCTMSYEAGGRTFTGCSPQAMIMTLEGLGVDAIGINCSLGPKEMESIVDEILKHATRPVMVQANAGLPSVEGGETLYGVGPEEYASLAARFVEKGTMIIGGCCGTTDVYIAELARRIDGIEQRPAARERLDGVCTPTNVVLSGAVRIAGERINPTGKPLLKQALQTRTPDPLLKEAIAQYEAGAHILDVNVGLPSIDEPAAMAEAVKAIQSIVDTPLQIDSTDPAAIEAGLRVYNGKAIVNSVNGEDRVLERILPVAKKYGAVVIGLTLDEQGIPDTAAGRVLIAKKILDKAKEYGFDPKDIYIDCLALTAAARQEGVRETLEAMRLVKEELGLKTALGVSNISFGLPDRALINRVFLAACLYQGLDLAIIDPLDREMMRTVFASNVLWNRDAGAEEYVRMLSSGGGTETAVFEPEETSGDLRHVILSGTGAEARRVTEAMLNEKQPLAIVDEYLIPALDLVGKRYEEGTLFLPALIRSAETARASFDALRAAMSRTSTESLSRGKIALATVKGDIHDIGKNLVKALLESYNFDVIDLGRDVASEEIAQRVLEQDIRLVGLSSLMTTTVQSMEETIRQIRKVKPDAKIMVGGAVLDADSASGIGADYYGRDAKEAVGIAQEYFRN